MTIPTLYSEMNRLLCQTLAPSTNRTYKSAFQSYLKFCQTHNLKALPFHETNVMLYVTSISKSSVSKAKIHIAAVKHFAAVIVGQLNPPLPRLYMLVRSIKRHSKKAPKRMPVTLNKLKVIHTFLLSSSWVQADKCMLWAAVTTAFFGFLRSSEYCSTQTKKYDAETSLCFENVTYKHSNIYIHIKASKTDPFREGCTICLSPSDAVICPVRNLMNYMHHKSTKSGPLFTFTDNTLLTRRRINTLLKDAIPSNNKAPISSHSLRIGAATTAAAAGLPRWLIQQLGRWTSDCFRTYIQLPSSTFKQVSYKLATTLKDGDTFDPDLVT